MKRFEKLILVLFMVAVAGLTVSACTKSTESKEDKKSNQKTEQEKEPSKEPEKEPEKEIPTFVVRVDDTIEKLPFQTIVEQKFDEAEGFLLKFAEKDTLDDAIKDGSVQLTVGEYTDVFALQKADVDARIVGNICNDLAVITTADSGFTSLADCKDQVVWHKAGTDGYALDYLLAQANFRGDFVKKNEVPDYEFVVEELKKGAKLAILPEPFAGKLEKEGYVCLARCYESRFCDRCLLASHSQMAEKKELFAAFYRAYDKAVNYLSTNPADTGIDYQPEFGLLEMPEDETLYDCYEWAKEQLSYTKAYERENLVEEIDAGEKNE